MRLPILFVNSNASEVVYQDLSKKHSAIEPPVWLGMLAQSCRAKGFEVAVIDCDAERLTTKQSAESISKHDPEIACFVVYGQNPQSSTPSMEGAVATAKALKKINPDITTLFVGGHVSALPQESLQESCIDLVALNEGVYAIHNLLRTKDFSKVKGIGYKDKDGIHLNEPERIVPQENLEEDLPGIAWDLLSSLSSYRTSGWHSWSNNSDKSPFASLYTSLGCPFKCNFCMINIINRTDNALGIASDKSSIFRHWRPEFIIKQFDKIAEMGVKNVKIADEMWVLKEEHFLKICDLLIKRDYGLNLWGYARVDTVKPYYLEKLKKAGFNWLGLGIESPDQTVRKDVIKGGFKEVKIMDVINMIRDSGIDIGANYIFGLPLDTMDSMKYTLDFAMKANTGLANFYTAIPFPGSPLYYRAKENGWALPDRYAGYGPLSYHLVNLPTQHLTAEQVLKFRDEAWMTYYSNPDYLSMLSKTYGQPAADNVRDTLNIKLKRKLLGD